MELVNRTPVPAHLRVSSIEGTDARCGLLTAKATFRVGDDAATWLDDQDPLPIFHLDQTTPLGLLPADLAPRRDPAFEVILIGVAHGGARVEALVELAVGDHRRRLLVTGDRRWSASLGAARPSDPAPIGAMPLTWERAYGGAAECWIDERSVFDLEHPMNRYGCGFDALALATDVGKAFKAPSGYPRLAAGYQRLLPNLEDPRQPIRRWADEPSPYCWATVPLEIGVHSQRAHDRVREGRPMSPEEALEMVHHRAHPDWILPTPPPAGSVVELTGATPRGRWAFRLPRLRVFADYQLGDRTGVRELAPQLLLLLPEQSRFYIVYRHFFTMQVAPGQPRTFRLRLVES